MPYLILYKTEHLILQIYKKNIKIYKKVFTTSLRFLLFLF